MSPIDEPLPLTGSYAGTASATFDEPHAVISGPGRIDYSNSRAPVAIVEVVDITEADPHYKSASPILMGQVIDRTDDGSISYGFSGHMNPCSEFVMAHGSGQLRATNT